MFSKWVPSFLTLSAIQGGGPSFEKINTGLAQPI